MTLRPASLTFLKTCPRKKSVGHWRCRSYSPSSNTSFERASPRSAVRSEKLCAGGLPTDVAHRQSNLPTRRMSSSHARSKELKLDWLKDTDCGPLFTSQAPTTPQAR